MGKKDLTVPAAPAAAPVAEAERAPMAEPEGGWPPDEYSGQAGAFVRDPYTGIRRPAEPEAGADHPEQAPA